MEVFLEKDPNILDTHKIGAAISGPRITGEKLWRLLGKRKHTPPCSSAELFFAEKNGVHRGKISVVDMGFPGFYRVFVSTTGLESFSFRPEKFSKRFSFGGGCVRFFLLWVRLFLISDISKPVVWRTSGLHPRFPWFPWFLVQHSAPCFGHKLKGSFYRG